MIIKYYVKLSVFLIFYENILLEKALLEKIKKFGSNQTF